MAPVKTWATLSHLIALLVLIAVFILWLTHALSGTSALLLGALALSILIG